MVRGTIIGTMLTYTGCSGAEEPPPLADEDPAPDDGSSFHAEGTWNDTAFDVGCDGMGAGYVGVAIGPVLDLVCLELGGAPIQAVAVGWGRAEPGSSATCGVESFVELITDDGRSVGCLDSPPTSFAFDVTELADQPNGDVLWAGTFQLVIDEELDVVEVSGSFRGSSTSGWK